MKNFVQEGERINYTAGANIAAGDVVIIGSLVGIAVADIANGETGVVALEGVYELPKDAPLVINQGDEVFWSVANSEVTKTATDTPIGVAFEGALSAATTVNVKLYGQGNGIPVAATVAALGAATDVTGVDGVGSNAASKADVDTRIEAIHTKIDAILTSLKNAGIMASA